jgi:phosphopantothenoylcysteine decarboxylase / phosphopantothenate---cysteine ligase
MNRNLIDKNARGIIDKKNEDLKVDIIGDNLSGKSVALCVTGGIAAIETPKLARYLRRYGAEVKAYMTPAASKFIGKAALEWATEQPVVTELSGMSEHICLEDLVLVAPSTTNTLNKIFQGQADNTVTTLVASALGMGKPVHLAPTMHESLYNNPFFLENLGRAEKYGIHIIPPRVGEGKAKMPRLDYITAEVCRELSTHPIKGKQILVTGGPTAVKIDDVRMITNRFRGSLGKRIATEAYLRGADVKYLLGNRDLKVPSFLDVLYHNDYDEYVKNVFSELHTGEYDAGIFSAAVADYRPKDVTKGKIPSRGALKTIELKETMKVIANVRSQFSDLHMVTFKYEDGVDFAKLLTIANKRINDGYQMVIANRAEDMKTNHQAYLVTKTGYEKAESSRDITEKLVNHLGRELCSPS